jgi:hypothetical protein
MDRLYVRGRENVHKKLLLQAAACNLALLMRSLHGAGKPRAAHDRVVEAIFAILAFLKAMESSAEPWLDLSRHYAASNFLIHSQSGLLSAVRKTGCLDTGFHEKAGRCQEQGVEHGFSQAKACHSFLSAIVPALRRVPVKAERSEPLGSLDRVAQCENLREEGMAGGIRCYGTCCHRNRLWIVRSHYPASIRTL